ncbi:MAG: hypothetical protein IIC61_05795 [Proteobacteria bacterium]|nr:hypothetical protein [Pseudomonadota bacterium]
MRKLIPIMLLAASSLAVAQGGDQKEVNEVSIAAETGVVTIASKGADVRNVLYDLFTQSKNNFVLEANIRFILYLSLTGVEFEEALNIVCTVTSLEYELDNGIYFIGKKKVGSGPLPKPVTQPKPQAKRGKLTSAELQKHLTTRFMRADLRKVYESFSEQTGIEIIVDANVPMYKIDAFLIDTSLEYALDVLARATQLKYTLNDNKQIIISKKS